MISIDSSHSLARYRFSAWELLPAAAAIAYFFVRPDYLSLGAGIFVTAIFAISLDLLIGFAGIITLGHSVFFGLGAYAAGLLARSGWAEPISVVLLSAAVAALAAAVTGPFVLKLKGLPLIMVTLGIAAVAYEVANKFDWLTGGHDGLPSLTYAPIFGLFRWSMYGTTGYVYSFIWLTVVILVARMVVCSSFGVALQGIRQNALRMRVIGAPVLLQSVIIYTISAALAGIGGALYAQTNSFVGLDTLSIDQGVFALAMVVLGGIGRLYGALLGAVVYNLVQDSAQQWNPYYWMFAIGVMLVLVVRFGKGGLLGIASDLGNRLLARAGARP